MPSLLGQLLRHSMREDGVSVADLADVCGVAQSTVRDWLTGRIVKPGHLAAIADLFGLPLELLQSIARRSDDAPAEIRAEEIAPADPGAPSPWLIVGYASLFEVPDLGREIILPGAWGMLPDTVPLWYEHGYQAEADLETPLGPAAMRARDRHAIPLGSTITLEQDAIGLWYEAPVAATRDMMDLAYLWAQTPINLRTSVGFNVPEGGEIVTDFGTVIAEAELKEISVVNWPRQPATSAELLPGNASRELISLVKLAAGAVGGYSI